MKATDHTIDRLKSIASPLRPVFFQLLKPSTKLRGAPSH